MYSGGQKKVWETSSEEISWININQKKPYLTVHMSYRGSPELATEL